MMRSAFTWGLLCVLLTLSRPAAAEIVRDNTGDFSVEVTDPQARFCTALPAPSSDDAGACTEVDLAIGQALSLSALTDTQAVGVVVAHFDGWEETLFVTRTEAPDAEVTQREADSFVGGLRAGIGKRLPPGAQVIGERDPAHADLLRIGDLQVARGIVRIQHGVGVPVIAKSKIAYQVIAKGGTYVLMFSADDAHFDEALAFAQRTVETVRTPPAARTTSRGSDGAEYQRGKRWGLIFGVAAVLVLGLMIFINRRRAR